jgi:hypothetical protein
MIVEALKQRGWACGMTGDGVNDAPALKVANIGIAVEGATDAAQAAADIVLTDPGLNTIVTAITTARMIFQRLRNYVIYRIACTIQLLLFFFIGVAIPQMNPSLFAGMSPACPTSADHCIPCDYHPTTFKPIVPDFTKIADGDEPWIYCPDTHHPWSLPDQVPLATAKTLRPSFNKPFATCIPTCKSTTNSTASAPCIPNKTFEKYHISTCSNQISFASVGDKAKFTNPCTSVGKVPTGGYKGVNTCDCHGKEACTCGGMHTLPFDSTKGPERYADNMLGCNKQFLLPVIAIVLITILNDGTIISIAYDYVIASKRPELWRLPEVFLVSTLLGTVAVVSSILLLYMGLSANSVDKNGMPDSVFHSLNVVDGKHSMSFGKVQTMMYLKISLSDFLTVFAARTRKAFCSRKPGNLLLAAACFAMGCSTLFSAFWPFGVLEPLEWNEIGVVWGYCICWFILQDVSKIGLYALIEFLTPAVLRMPCFLVDNSLELLASRLDNLEEAIQNFQKSQEGAGKQPGKPALKGSIN